MVVAGGERTRGVFIGESDGSREEERGGGDGRRHVRSALSTHSSGRVVENRRREAAE